MQPFLEKYKKQLAILGGVVAAVLIYLLFLDDSPHSASIETIDQMTIPALDEPSINPETEIETEHRPVMVDVKGAVKYPGVYTLSEEQRIVDAVEAAGGYTDDANPVLVNHAQRLQDEMVIYIPKTGDEPAEVMEQIIQAGQATGSGSESTSGKININKAMEAELTQLPGIGPSKAGAIIQHRNEHGAFQVIDDLKKVTGIGDKTFEQLKDLIDVK
ncbi:helix-hairpin-helix domain-containing protein [Solibacillus sp. FSL W7-1436]|uniref:helix-hairpin-helix domain-containing protein n=1 Tax=Solibacillus sp. FSL W7-1436 TaxID=2921705 RepID=UPI0030F5F3D8